MARPPAPIKTVPFSKEKPLPQPVPPSPTSAEVNIGDDEQPVASSSTPPRPGTSGTLTALQLDRLRASENLKAAARKEKAYRAKKRAATARANYSECKHHLKLAKAHFSSGFKLLGGVIKSTPYLFTEKLEGRKQKKEEKKREKVLEKRRKLDEELARVEREERAERERERREQRERDRDSDSESDRDGDVSDEERQEEEERPRDDEKKKNEAKSKGKGKARR
ncbi:hypothetical protein QBC38DRAFT_454854 [Podospora fimiseda]|uniref:Uncharacterized protein n=1 Tax=Podospora fimiseda TaxID=252190 RepID=A0AAN7BR29_9PEZI|nr:hypothetical protein QBC38DRAFT_454854 [Podospora fimiseda]